jgi:hypothetical protein
VLPAIACDHATPSICAVGRPSAVTVVGFEASFGSTGAVSAEADAAVIVNAAATTRAVDAISPTPRRADVDRTD